MARGPGWPCWPGWPARMARLATGAGRRRMEEVHPGWPGWPCWPGWPGGLILFLIHICPNRHLQRNSVDAAGHYGRSWTGEPETEPACAGMAGRRSGAHCEAGRTPQWTPRRPRHRPWTPSSSWEIGRPGSQVLPVEWGGCGLGLWIPRMFRAIVSIVPVCGLSPHAVSVRGHLLTQGPRGVCSLIRRGGAPYHHHHHHLQRLDQRL